MARKNNSSNRSNNRNNTSNDKIGLYAIAIVCIIALIAIMFIFAQHSLSSLNPFATNNKSVAGKAMIQTVNSGVDNPAAISNSGQTVQITIPYDKNCRRGLIQCNNENNDYLCVNPLTDPNNCGIDFSACGNACASGICRNGECFTPQCSFDSDCGTNAGCIKFSCIDQICQASNSSCGSTPQCTTDNDCTTAQVCNGGQCTADAVPPVINNITTQLNPEKNGVYIIAEFSDNRELNHIRLLVDNIIINDNIPISELSNNIGSNVALTFGSHIIEIIVYDSAGNGISTQTTFEMPEIISPICTDSDGGNNVYVKGHTQKFNVDGTGSSFDDVCVTQNGGAGCSGSSCVAVAEGYCQNNEVTNTLMQCPTGLLCNDGACINQTTRTQCTDSDGGLNYNVKGVGTGIYVGSSAPVVCDSNGTCTPTNATYSTYYDNCYSTKQLNEGFCDSNGMLSAVAYMCPTGTTCQDGACINQTTRTQVCNYNGICELGENLNNCYTDCQNEPAITISLPKKSEYTTPYIALSFRCVADQPLNMSRVGFELQKVNFRGNQVIIRYDATSAPATNNYGYDSNLNVSNSGNGTYQLMVFCWDMSSNSKSTINMFNVTTSTTCGNNICEAGETATSCPQDCGAVIPTPTPINSQQTPTLTPPPIPTTQPPETQFCGNNICEAGETATSCPADCGATIPQETPINSQQTPTLTPPTIPATPPPETQFCGDNICNNGETQQSCPQDCRATIPQPTPITPPKVCVPNGICLDTAGKAIPRNICGTKSGVNNCGSKCTITGKTTCSKTQACTNNKCTINPGYCSNNTNCKNGEQCVNNICKAVRSCSWRNVWCGLGLFR